MASAVGRVKVEGNEKGFFEVKVSGFLDRVVSGSFAEVVVWVLYVARGRSRVFIFFEFNCLFGLCFFKDLFNSRILKFFIELCFFYWVFILDIVCLYRYVFVFFGNTLRVI